MMAKVNKHEHLLKTVCRNIINNPRRVDADAVGAFRSAVLRYADLQHITPDNLYQSDGEVRGAWDVIDASNVLKELDDRERSSVTGAVYPRGDRWYLDEVADPDDIDDDDDDLEDEDEDIGKVEHHASTVADLLVEAGSFPHRTAALHHLLRKPSGQALLSRLRKAAKTEKKEQPMKSLTSILKDNGPIAVAKHVVATGHTFGISEAEYVKAASRYASELYGLPGDRAFAKLCDESDGDVVRACGKLKAAEFNVFDIEPVVVGGEDARDVNDPSAAVRAREEIERLGREKFPFLSADQQFARIFEDKNYAALAAQAHSRPQPTTIYAGPGSTAPGRGVYTKADPGTERGHRLRRADVQGGGIPQRTSGIVNFAMLRKNLHLPGEQRVGKTRACGERAEVKREELRDA